MECVGLALPEDGSPDGKVRLTIKKSDQDEQARAWTETFDWVVGADGVRSAIRAELEARTKGRKVRSIKMPERNEFVYRTLPLDLRPKCVRLVCVCVFFVLCLAHGKQARNLV